MLVDRENMSCKMVELVKHEHIETFTAQGGGHMHLRRVIKESGHCRCTHAKRSQEGSDERKEADRVAICV